MFGWIGIVILFVVVVGIGLIYFFVSVGVVNIRVVGFGVLVGGLVMIIIVGLWEGMWLMVFVDKVLFG